MKKSFKYVNIEIDNEKFSYRGKRVDAIRNSRAQINLDNLLAIKKSNNGEIYRPIIKDSSGNPSYKSKSFFRLYKKEMAEFDDIVGEICSKKNIDAPIKYNLNPVIYSTYSIYSFVSKGESENLVKNYMTYLAKKYINIGWKIVAIILFWILLMYFSNASVSELIYVGTLGIYIFWSTYWGGKYIFRTKFGTTLVQAISLIGIIPVLFVSYLYGFAGGGIYQFIKHRKYFKNDFNEISISELVVE